MPVPVVPLSAVQVLALSGIGVAIGITLKSRVALLEKLHIPAPIIGGLLYSLIVSVLRDRVVNFEMDMVLQNFLGLTFFTTIGLSASVRLLRQGGGAVLLLLMMAAIGAGLQNLLGMSVAKMLGIDPRIGILAGAVSLAGGPGTALAFGKTFEEMGVAGATVVAVASAMYGIVVAGLLGGPLGAFLIRRFQLKPGVETRIDPAAVADSSGSMLTHIIVITTAMGVGSLISAAVQRTGIVLPAYMGAMAAAAILRNIIDASRWIALSENQIQIIGNAALYLFIVMALLTLQLWQLATLAIPILVILILQTLLVVLFTAGVVHRVMGRDYDSAVISAGYSGFMLGITANAVACMDVVTHKYGPSVKAFLVVPIVGAFLIDFTNSLLITLMANWFR